MYRLRFRKSIIGFLLLIGGAIGLSFLRLNPFNSSTNFDLPLLYILPGQILLPLLFALFQYKACPIIQRLGAIFSTFALISLLGLVGNLSADPLVLIQKDLLLHFNAIQLAVINLLGLMVAANLLNVEKISSYADTKAAEAELGRLKQVKVDPETQAKWEKAASHADRQAEGRSLRSTMTNLKAITLTEPGQELRPQLTETPAAKAAPSPAPTNEEVGGLAGLLDRIGEAPEAVPDEDLVEESPQVESPAEFSLSQALEEQEQEPVAAAQEEPSTPAPVKEEPARVEPSQSQPTMPGFKTTSQAKGPSETKATDSQQLPAVQAPPEKPVQPSATANRLAAMKRRNTSTFTKLQSLSASSADSLQQAPLVESGTDDSLKSLLDRLDDGKVEEPPQPLSPPREIVLDYLFQDESPAAPGEEEASAEAQATHSSLSQRLSGLPEAATAQVDTTPEAEAVAETPAPEAVEALAETPVETPAPEAVEALVETPAETPAPEAVEALVEAPAETPAPEAVEALVEAPAETPAPEAVEALVEAPVETPAPEAVEALVETPVETPAPEAVEAASPETPAETPAPEAVEALAETPVETPAPEAVEAASPETTQEAEVISLEILEAPALDASVTQEPEILTPEEIAAANFAPPAPEPVAQEALPALFEGGVDKDIDDIFQTLAPAEAQKEVVQQEILTPAPEAVAETPVEANEAPEATLFEGGVDKDIDAIFQTLAPAEAQKEVVPQENFAPAPEALAETPIEANEAPEATLFEGGVDKDIDAIFQTLAPAEAQKEVVPQETFTPQAEALAETPVEAKENEAPEATLFGSGVDKDIDDIFQNLAPPEAQKEVGQAAAAELVEPILENVAPEAALFASGVDKDIDDIFSNLAPAEAQKEVVSLDLDIFATMASSAPIPDATQLLEAPLAETQAVESLAQPASGGLFAGGVDSDIDSIFSNLAPPEAQKEISPAKPAVTSQEAGSSGIFSNALGEDIDNIFSGLTDSTQLDVTPETLLKFKAEDKPTVTVAGQASATAAAPSPKNTGDMPAVSPEMAKEILKPAAEVKPAPAPLKEPSAQQFKEVKEFGRLSSRSAATPKAAGETVGAMKTIGKLLLDVQAVENIIKAGETKKIGAGLSTAKIISAARGEGIKNILTTIDTYEGVSGSLIVGHDGLVISSTVGSGWDKDMLGALSTALLSTSNLATKKLEIGKLRQMVLLTHHGEGAEQTLKATLLTDVEVGILAVFVEKAQVEKLDGLLETIQKAVHGG